jgi:chemotaxis methyl-accepting protein methylase
MPKDGLLQILDKVHQNKNFDFRSYKESTLKRRIERRLRATKTKSYQQYIKVLDADPGEYTKLIDNLTIQVTEFFRNPEAWQIIREQVLPDIIRRKFENREQLLQVWCPGCATGEEVYSVAILLEQLLDERRTNFEVNIWGTDIDMESLHKAEKAEYKPDITKSIPQDILNRYFNFDGNFRVKSGIRSWTHFRSNDLVLDEPLKQTDMIICRNVAIYFTRPLQEKIFINFGQGLNDKGYLFLGKAETLIGPAREEFKVINKRWRVYQKIDPGNNTTCKTLWGTNQWQTVDCRY